MPTVDPGMMTSIQDQVDDYGLPKRAKAKASKYYDPPPEYRPQAKTILFSKNQANPGMSRSARETASKSPMPAPIFSTSNGNRRSSSGDGPRLTRQEEMSLSKLIHTSSGDTINDEDLTSPSSSQGARLQQGKRNDTEAAQHKDMMCKKH